MLTFLIAISLLLQGIPLSLAQTGTVSGIVRSTDGVPASHVRVAAVTQPETPDDRNTTSMSSLAETDDEGRYVLEGIPQGRYYIAAGRVDYPTYFPGTIDITLARIVTVKPGAPLSGVNFSVANDSYRPLDPITVVIPVQARVEGPGKVPVSSGGKFVSLQLTWAWDSPLTTASPIRRLPLGMNTIEIASDFSYDVRVTDLPEGYTLKELKYGAVDLRTNQLSVPTSYARSSNRPLQSIELILGYTPPVRSGPGVHVSGAVKDKTPRTVYLSGIPGIFYADGSFEFFNITPGKHTLAGLDAPVPGSLSVPSAALGVLVVVGDRDVENIELKTAASPLPFNMRQPRDPAPIGEATPGSVLPLASTRGVVTETSSNKPVPEALVKITGYGKTETFPTDVDGRFEIPGLFPGEYRMEVEFFGHEHLIQTLSVGAENVSLDLHIRRLY